MPPSVYGDKLWQEGRGAAAGPNWLNNILMEKVQFLFFFINLRKVPLLVTTGTRRLKEPTLVNYRGTVKKVLTFSNTLSLIRLNSSEES